MLTSFTTNICYLGTLFLSYFASATGLKKFSLSQLIVHATQHQLKMKTDCADLCRFLLLAYMCEISPKCSTILCFCLFSSINFNTSLRENILTAAHSFGALTKWEKNFSGFSVRKLQWKIVSFPDGWMNEWIIILRFIRTAAFVGFDCTWDGVLFEIFICQQFLASWKLIFMYFCVQC